MEKADGFESNTLAEDQDLTLRGRQLGYRQIMYFVMLKSVLTALRGVIVGWNKLELKAQPSKK